MYKLILVFIIGAVVGSLIGGTAFAASNLAKRLAGRILLQVEDKGQAWYVDPVGLKRYPLERPVDCLNLLWKKGLGITNKDLTEIPIAQQTLTPDKTANWKTYSVPEMQFMYPDNWQVGTKTVGVGTVVTFVVPKKSADDLHSETLILFYTPNQGGLTLEEWWSEASKSDRYQKTRETTIAGFSTYVLTLPETDAPPRYIFVTKSRTSGGWIFDITARGESVNKVLATFKATK